MAHANRFQWTFEQEIQMAAAEEAAARKELEEISEKDLPWVYFGSPFDDQRPTIDNEGDPTGIGDDYDLGEYDPYFESLVRTIPPLLW